MRKFEVAKGFEGKDVILPTRGSQYSSGYDIHSLETYTLKKNELHVFSTGIKAKMEHDEVLLLVVRSSIGIKKGLVLANQVGVIDCDYYSNEKNDGHIMVALRNMSDEDVTINKDDRICQGIFMKYLLTDDDNTTSFRTGGVGSTGK